MTHQLHRQGLPLVVAAVLLFAAACSGGGSKSSSTTILSAGSEGTPVASPSSTAAGATPTLEAVTAGVRVDGVLVEEGSSRPIAINERIELAPDSRARLRIGELDVLLKTAIAHVVSWDPQEVALYLESGIIESAFDVGSRAHLLLTTSSDTTIRTVQPGTKIWVCQADGVACMCVRNGAAEWEQQGKIVPYVAPDCSFAQRAETPQAAKCVPAGTLDAWYQTFVGEGAVADLGGLVNAAPLCAAVPPPDETTSVASTPSSGSASRRPPTTPAPPTTQPSTTAQPTTTLEPSTTAPSTTAASTTAASTTAPSTTAPSTTAASTTVAPPVETTPPTSPVT
jgi:hypothetical protein